MLGWMIAVAVGFIAGIVVALVFPIGLWINRFIARRTKPVEFVVGDQTFMLRPGDSLRWERRSDEADRNDS